MRLCICAGTLLRLGHDGGLSIGYHHLLSKCNHVGTRDYGKPDSTGIYSRLIAGRKGGLDLFIIHLILP
jgi:hypothetical protein